MSTSKPPPSLAYLGEIYDNWKARQESPREEHPAKPPEYYGRQLMQPVGIWRVDGGPGTPDGSITCDIPAS